MVCVNDKTGKVYYDAKGYAGTGTGRNNSDAQDQSNLGPIPRGEWVLTGDWHDSKNTGKNTMVLSPGKSNECSTTGRGCSSFRIHGDNKKNDASHGCIVLPPNRSTIPSGETIVVTK